MKKIKLRKIISMVMMIVMLVTSISFTDLTSVTTHAATAYYPSMSFNLGKLSNANSYLGKLTDSGSTAEMTTITMAGYNVFCMELGGSLSRYNAFYKADVNEAYGSSYRKYFKGAAYYYQDENEEFTLSGTARYVVSQIMIWRILQIRKAGKSGTYNNIMNGFESTFKEIINYWGECNANTAWNEIKTVMGWCNNDLKKVSDNVKLHLWTHADGTQPLLAADVTPVEPMAYVKIHKEGEIANANVKGAVYGIYSKQACGEKSLICSLKTDEDGNAITTAKQAAKLKNSTTYYIKEIQAPKGSELNETVYKIKTSADVTKSQAVKLNVSDKQYKIKINTVKVDSTDETKKLSGAIFRVSQWNKNDKKYVTYKEYTTSGTTGDFTTEWLYYTKSNEGKWLVEEIKAPANYKLTGYKKYFQINKSNNGDTVKYQADNPPIPQEGYIEINKKAYVGDLDITKQVDLSATFTVYSDSSCTKVAGTIVTNGTGYGKSGKLTAGTYYVKETKWSSDVEPTITTAQAYTVKAGEVTEIEGVKAKVGCQEGKRIGLKLRKTDSYDDSINLEGVTFGIYEWNGISWTLKYKELTNAEGIIEIPVEDNKLYRTKTNQGKFKIVELATLDGYTLDSTPRYVTITEDNKDTVVDIGVFKNTPIGGNLEIQKIVVDKVGGKVLGIDFSSNLLNITYGLYTDAAFTKPVNDSIKLDKDGKAVIKDLRAGSYYLVEKTANGSIFAATDSLSSRVIPVTINAGKTTMVDGELGYSSDGGETWTDCWSGAVATSLANTFSAVDMLPASNMSTVATVFGNATYEVVKDSDTSENKTTINDVLDTWKELSDEELDMVICYSEDVDLANFLISLSDEDLELILAKDTSLIYPYTIYEPTDEETGEMEAISEVIYWEYLMMLPYQPATMSTLNGKTGYFNIVITGNGKTSNMKVTVKVNSTNTTNQSVSTTYAASGTNNHGFKLASASGATEMAGVTPGTVGTGTGNYNLILVEFYYTQPAHYGPGTYSKSGNYSSHRAEWYTTSNVEHSPVASTRLQSVYLNLTNAGLRTIDDNTYHVTFKQEMNRHYGGLIVNPNGGTWQGYSTNSYKTAACAYEYSLVDPVRTGYTFLGWSEVSDGVKSMGDLKSKNIGSADNKKFIFCSESTTALPATPSVPTSAQLAYYTTIKANWQINEYPVNFVDVLGTNGNGKELGRITKQVPYGTAVKGADIGSSTVLGAYYTNYYYVGSSSATVSISGTTVYRYFSKTPTPVNEPNLLKNILKTIELDIIKKDSTDETKTLDATFDVLEYSDAVGDYVPYLTGVKSHDRIALRYNSNNTKGKFKVIETGVEDGYTMSGTFATITLADGVTLPYYENLLGVDEDMGVFVLGRGYNTGDIVRTQADTSGATWYQCLVANKDEKLTNTTYWKQITASNYTRYDDLINGTGEWNADLDVVTSMAVEFVNRPKDAPGTTSISINKHNNEGDILPDANFVAYYADDMTKCVDFEIPEKGTQYVASQILITDEQTHAVASDLIYTLNLVIKEEKAPYGYIKGDDINVKITYTYTNSEWTVLSSVATFKDETTQDITSGIAIDIPNNDVKLNIQLNKKSFDLSLPVSTLEGAVYGIYDNADCTSLAKEIVVGKNGNADVQGLTLKNYWIKEISAPTSGLYEMSDEIIFVDASELYDGEEGITAVNTYVSVSEKPIYGEILLKKLGYTDSTLSKTENLEGAGFTLYRMPEIPEGEDENEYIRNYNFTNETPVVREIKTDSNGLARFNDLVLSDYVLVESTVPEGFLKSDNIIVHLTKNYAGNTDETAYPVIAYNEPYTAPIKLYKVSAKDNTKYLEGTVFKIFDVAANGFIGETVYSYDEDGNLNETVEEKLFTTDENGEVITDSLLSGTYRIYEVSSTPGFKLNEEPVEVVIGEGKETGRDDNDYPYYEVVIENEPTDTYFTKADITTKEEIEGGHYKVSDSEGNIIDEWDGTGTPHHIYGLEPGNEYTFSEEIAPEGYVVGENVQFTINEDGTPTEVIMYDDYIKVDISKQDLTTGEELPGATLQILDLDGNILYEWVSTTEPHRIDRLPAGTYILREKIAPDGWVLTEDVQFTVGETSEVQEVVMYNDYTRTAFIKLAEDTLEPLPGCVMQVLDLDGNVIEEWTTTEEPHYIYKLTAGQTYIYHEVSAVDGYEVAEDIRFVAGEEYVSSEKADISGEEVVDKEGIGIEDDSHIEHEEDTLVPIEELVTTVAEEDADSEYADTEIEDVPEDAKENDTFKATELVTITMKDSPIEIIPEKVDGNGNPVYGALMQILDLDGNVVYEWETGLMQTKGFRVVPGTYIIHEVSAPAGFQLCEDIEVIVTDKDVYVEVIDLPMKATISKVDEAGNFLPGAILQILDEAGVVVAEWTTGDTAYVVSNLIAGKTYTLHEKVAPEGFVLADDVEFTMDGTDVKVTMVDKETDLTVKKVNPLGIGIDGAVLQIINSDGEIVKEFTSSAKGNNFRGLPKGEYTLHEKEASEGFELAEDIEFTIGDESVTVKMVDEFTNLKLPLTGGTPLNMLLFGVSLILLGMVGFIFGRRKRTTDNQ